MESTDRTEPQNSEQSSSYATQNLPSLAQEATQEFYFNSEEIKAAAKEDMDWFGAIALPDVITLAFPAFYVALWRIVVSSFDKVRDFSKFALGFPRGHGKTMVVKLLILYAILFTKKRYILVIGANKDKAEAIISDVCDMLDSDNIRQLFGNWRYDIETDTKHLKKFTFAGRSVILEGAGQGTAIRGAQHKNARPDFIVLDDAQTKECAESITEAKSFQQWFIGTVLKLKNPMGCTYIYIGNMYKDMEIIPKSRIYSCMLRNLQLSSEWTSFIVGGITADFKALWEELHPLENLIAEYRGDLQLGQPEIFFAEVLNDPKASTSYYIDAAKVIEKVVGPEETHQGNYIVIDPATSKQTPDQVVIGYFEIYDDVPHWAECYDGKYNSMETGYKAVELALSRQCTCIVVEANAYQYALCEIIEYVMQQMGVLGINVIPIYNGGRSKNSRILANFKTAMQGQMTFSPQVRAKYISQAFAFDPTVTNNLDDILDTAAMAEKPAIEHRGAMVIPGDLTIEEKFRLMNMSATSTPPTRF